MTIARKGLRKIVVEGKTFYWKDFIIADENRNFLCEFDPYVVCELPHNEEWSWGAPHALPVQIAAWIRDNLCQTKRK